ncbi:MAG: alpha/beta fold hydrolase [Bacilli bacterium]|nr:alpha/beta fold hydrolase [Bacilli bacterium]
MKKEEFFYRSSDNVTDIHAIKWDIENPRAVLQVAHGVTEYIDRYDEFAKYLNEKGIVVVGNDHLGHGKSISEEKGPMYFGKEGSWDFAVEDLYSLYTKTKIEYPDIPYFILGFSLGSFLVRTLLIKHSEVSDGAILVGTGQTSWLNIKLGLMMANKEAKEHGDNAFTEKIDDLTFGTYNKKFKPNKTKLDWLCSNEDALDLYMKDPSRGESFSAGLFRELLSGMMYDRDIDNIKKMNRDLPILFLSGSDDPVGDYGKGVDKAYKDFKKAGIKNLSIKMYPGLRHDILNEKSKNEIYEDVSEWADSLVGKKR